MMAGLTKAERSDAMNEALARALDLDPDALRAMPPAAALVELKKQLDAYKITGAQVAAWQRDCLNEADPGACMTEKARASMGGGGSLLGVVAFWGLGAGALAFALTYWRGRRA